MMSAPVLLLLDEPSLGLAPVLCKDLFRILTAIRDTGIGILLVEQNARLSLAIADRGYLLENARIVGENKASLLMNDPAVQKAYLGGTCESEPHDPQTAVPAHSVTVPVSLDRTSAATTVPVIPGIMPSDAAGDRKKADDLLGVKVNDLVRRAEDIQSQHIKTIRSEGPGISPSDRTGGIPSGHLSKILTQIEKAAATARKPEEIRAASTAPKHRKVEPEDFQNLPKIEIYRRVKTSSEKGPGKLIRMKE
jgi:branched-chain amino acid transport system ATP-binding protein